MTITNDPKQVAEIIDAGIAPSQYEAIEKAFQEADMPRPSAQRLFDLVVDAAVLSDDAIAKNIIKFSIWIDTSGTWQLQLRDTAHSRDIANACGEDIGLALMQAYNQLRAKVHARALRASRECIKYEEALACLPAIDWFDPKSEENPTPTIE